MQSFVCFWMKVPWAKKEQPTKGMEANPPTQRFKEGMKTNVKCMHEAKLHFSSSSRKSCSASSQSSLSANRAPSSYMLLIVSGWELPSLARPRKQERETE